MKVTASHRAVICCMLITLTHSATCQTMKGELGGIETKKNEKKARMTVTDGEGSDLPSLITRPSIIDEWCN